MFITLLLMAAAVGIGTYRIQAAISEPNTPLLEDWRIAQLREALSEHRDAAQAFRDDLDEVRGDARSQLDALGLRLGELQAHVVRLNALGERLTDISGLDGGEFRFDEPPGLGGPRPLEESEAYEYPEFIASLDGLEYLVNQHENQLSVLEELILGRNMDRVLFPDGWPAEGGWVSSLFGYRRDPFSGRRAFHSGIDIAGRRGMEVRAAASGVVAVAGRRSNYGLAVELQHGNGYSTLYAHNAEVLVEVGDRVIKGQPVARMGSSGRSTGPHLHFEVRKGNERVDPRKFLRASR
jgi:murein DD-endopeptidase MepM/ murein hydrolase activator NlpD